MQHLFRWTVYNDGSINNTVSVANINGDVHLNEISGSTSVALINGGIDDGGIDDGGITLPLDGTIDMSKINGSIELVIPQNTSVEFLATVTNGNIGLANLVLQDEVRSPISLRGTLGGGQGTISLSTINGNINASGF